MTRTEKCLRFAASVVGGGMILTMLVGGLWDLLLQWAEARLVWDKPLQWTLPYENVQWILVAVGLSLAALLVLIVVAKLALRVGFEQALGMMVASWVKGILMGLAMLALSFIIVIFNLVYGAVFEMIRYGG